MDATASTRMASTWNRSSQHIALDRRNARTSLRP
jgi:hypothetical protein